MTNIPFNATPIYDDEDNLLDDSGKRVIVNSIGGKSWPDDVWKRALENVGGVILYGPHRYWYMAQSPNKNGKLVPTKFETQPSWCVLLDGYDLEITFIAQELKIVKNA